MEIDQVGSRSFDMSFIWKFEVMLFEVDMPFLIDTSDDLMLIDSSKYLSIFSLKCELEFLSVEKLPYFVGFFELQSSLILRFFLFFFDLSHTFPSDLSCESLRDEHIPSLSTRHFDDISFVPDMGYIGEKLYGKKVDRHRSNI